MVELRGYSANSLVVNILQSLLLSLLFLNATYQFSSCHLLVKRVAQVKQSVKLKVEIRATAENRCPVSIPALAAITDYIH